MARRPAVGASLPFAVVLCAAVLGAAALAQSPAAEARKVPLWRSVTPTGLGIRFHLTADWGIQNGPSLDKGWKWEGFSPGQAAWIRISTINSTLDFAELERVYVSNLRTSTQRAVKSDPHGFFRSGRTVVGGVPAEKITIRASGLSVAGAGEVTTITYALVRAGLVYVFEFDVGERYAARYLPAFTRVIETLRFTNAA